MVENKGWISLYRSLLDKPIWQCSTPEQKTIFITILLLANHKEREWEWQGQPYKCKPGQFITSIPSLVERCGKGITTQKVRTALNKFKKYGFLTDKSTNNGRLITIVNWELYQGIKNETNIQVNRQVTGNQQADNRQVTPNNNVNNVNNVNKNIYSPIIDYLNKKADKKFKAETKETQRLINGRIKEGFKLEDFKKVIDNKCNEWIGKTTREGKSCEDWLNPQTLFRPSNFGKYLNQKSISNNQNKNTEDWRL
ncbi:conserved phage C-terminal domain-containing protein [Clostridium tetani]|uniref:Phage conserved hypothetical protein C-terminal domain-containing protein n=1 Tax=Clostridium tetani TaxID=1513 RepID=A0ABY0EP29_CLOTA|nr:conserved phage C-terminal domain-containing protein [Clostridium tetani]RXI55927.1 hypothetical protein DP131_07730 [Clostridium tetani]RXI66052.1 hypothetical protein DQN76_13405 [Clostridium tetani]